MSELKLPRLLAAAKEFNIGQDTLIDFLVGKGFSKDELKPTAKLSEGMYRALQQEFQSDKVAKTKADAIEIPKNVQAEKKRKDEEDISIKVTKPVFKEEPKPEPPPEPKKEEPKPVVEAKEEKPEVVKAEAPTVEGPKIIDKIDLSTIDSSTKPKKSAKKKTEETAEAPAAKEEKPKKKGKKAAEEPVTEAPVAAPEPEAPKDEEPQIVRIEAEKLTGPKILGKIELPVDSDTRPKQGSAPAGGTDEKRKPRKRIPIEKKGDQPPSDNRGAFNRDGGGRDGGFQRGGGGRQGAPRTGNRPTIQKGGAGAGRGNARGPHVDKEIDQKEIQDKIRETQARLAGGGGGKGKNVKAKKRREKRQEAAEAGDVQDNKLQVTEFVTVSELANLMDVSFAEVISKCMSLGIMVSINQRLDAEVIELVAGEFDYEVEFIGVDDAAEIDDEEDADEADDLSSRAPIVTIMGHVDHGKTSLLDYIRSANVVAGEAGGITQHIGAYEVSIPNGKHITFLDTPGHEAFTAMRARGAKVTDIAVIVVAADDAVMPQTKEAISHAQAAGVPMIFAVNKIDKDGANPQKIYEQLAGMNILVESWGGKFQSQELSAKKGLNVDLLLEKILLEAEILDLKANPDRKPTAPSSKHRWIKAAVTLPHCLFRTEH
jgi:translation initiation factor IF-2